MRRPTPASIARRTGRRWAAVACAWLTACGSAKDDTDYQKWPEDTAPPVEVDASEAVAEVVAPWPGSGLLRWDARPVTLGVPSVVYLGDSRYNDGAGGAWAVQGPLAGRVSPSEGDGSAWADGGDGTQYLGGGLGGGGDLSGDGLPDVAWTEQDAARREFVRIASAPSITDAPLEPIAQIDDADGGSFGAYRMAISPDFDGDGVADLVASAGESGHCVQLFSGLFTGDRADSDGDCLWANWYYEVNASGDVDGDGYFDVTLASHEVNDVGLLLGGPVPDSPVSSLPIAFVGPETVWDIEFVGDLDDDGTDDLALDLPSERTDMTQESGDGCGEVLLYTGLRAGTYTTGDATSRLWSDGSDIFIGENVDGIDVDGSGQSDLLVGFGSKDGGEVGRWHGVALFLDPLRWGPRLKWNQADLRIVGDDGARGEVGATAAFFENDGDGVADILTGDADDLQVYDGATLLGRIAAGE